MSERVCQFFLRGRCQRQKCEFRHPADQAVPRGPIPDRSGGASSRETLCKFFLSTGCKFGASCHFRHIGRERRKSRFGVCKVQNFGTFSYVGSTSSPPPLHSPPLTGLRKFHNDFSEEKFSLLHTATFRSRERRSRSRSFEREVRMHRR